MFCNNPFLVNIITQSERLITFQQSGVLFNQQEVDDDDDF